MASYSAPIPDLFPRQFILPRALLDIQTLAMLVVQPVTPADIPAITSLWYEGFGTSSILTLMPDTPGIRQWWNDANLHDLLYRPTARYWKVVDDATPEGPIVAYAKWDMESAEDRGNRFPPWHWEMDSAGCSNFFGGLERQRQAIFQGQNNYCISPPPPRHIPLSQTGLYTHCLTDLDMLCTRPEYRGQGAGSMLVAQGCKEADQDQMPAYVDATAEGAPLYARYGFEDRTVRGIEVPGVTSMVRDPK